MKIPQHLAIIMDGNGRWAQARGHNRFYGHVRGARVAKSIIEECTRLKVPYLTLFAFSTENWLRPSTEVNFLMYLLRRHLKRERENLIKQNIRFTCIGDSSALPPEIRQEVRLTEEATAQNTGMCLVFALSYGGRQELVQAAQQLALDVVAQKIHPSEIDEAALRLRLPSQFLPDPDLILRTSGENRLSNFFLWQAAYSEFIFESAPWPDFNIEKLHEVLTKFSQRERRYGKTHEQVSLKL